jgi:hypothetical protein
MPSTAFINTIALYPIGPETSVHTLKLSGSPSGPFILASIGVVVNTGSKPLSVGNDAILACTHVIDT